MGGSAYINFNKMTQAIIMDFSLSDMVSAIEREIQKRATTYPKILAKMQKQGDSPEDIANVQNEQIQQTYHLQNAKFSLENEYEPDNTILEGIKNELKRELKMRKKCYSRWVWLHSVSQGKRGISQETAMYELAIWKSIIVHFEG